MSIGSRRSKSQDQMRVIERLGPCVLEGARVHLEPLRRRHAAPLGILRTPRELWSTPVANTTFCDAFEDWSAERVQFTTDVNNLHSQRAILRLGAKFEGKLRSNKRRLDGSMRDSMVCSIMASEWPAVRKRLLVRIDAPTRTDSS